MRVKFLRDFQGKETRERFYRKNEVADLPDSMASQLVADKAAIPDVSEVAYVSTPQFENAYFESPAALEDEVEPYIKPKRYGRKTKKEQV